VITEAGAWRRMGDGPVKRPAPATQPPSDRAMIANKLHTTTVPTPKAGAGARAVLARQTARPAPAPKLASSQRKPAAETVPASTAGQDTNEWQRLSHAWEVSRLIRPDDSEDMPPA
jgi:hypothetical protein